MGKVGFMLLGGVIAIVGLGVLILITMFVSWIQEKMIMYKINKENNLNRQLTKSKELLKWALHSDPEHDEDFEEKWKEAEQFLNEVEK